MSAGLTNTDTLISARNITPWHGLGVVLKRHPRRLEDALRKSGLGWTVRQEPLYRRDKTTVDGWRADIRSDTREVLGVVTNRYTVIENREAFAFLANLLGSELAFETAGSLHGGQRVFVTILTWIIEQDSAAVCSARDWRERGLARKEVGRDVDRVADPACAIDEGLIVGVRGSALGSQAGK
jgi:hypothetical protein